MKLRLLCSLLLSVGALATPDVERGLAGWWSFTGSDGKVVRDQ